VKFCRNCILPDTRPNLVLDVDGVCNACKSHAKKSTIDWGSRKKQFDSVVQNAKARGSEYDCVIPVSGGKDSTWQVAKCLDSGLHPLAVTWKTPARTTLGQQNLDNLVELGVDHIDYQVNPRVEAKFLLRSLERYGATAIPMHMAIFNMPLRIAVQFNIPLVVWGENSAVEYGGTQKEQQGFRLDQGWLQNFGVMQGTTAADWISDNLTKEELTPYFGPTDTDLEKANVSAVFMGHYFCWDAEHSLRSAKERGFKPRADGPKTGYYNYADIDCDFISIHHWLKWYKFGFSRSMDNLSLEIRNQRMTRNKALEILKAQLDRIPHKDIEKFCLFVGISKEHFFEVCEGFRNTDIWSHKNGTWRINNFIVDDWNWKQI